VVGGGAVGVEVVGELVAANMELDDAGMISLKKRIGIITRKDRLLPYFTPKASQLARKFMDEHRVQLHLNQDYNDNFRIENQYDYVIKCEGMFFNADFLTNNPNFTDCVSYTG
jgi:pyruvate/2-oxoglutarate dehydrogenase complex dihydrolipoamide dehydrogenase (E3) component